MSFQGGGESVWEWTQARDQADSRLPTPQVAIPAEKARENQKFTTVILTEIHKQFTIKHLESILTLGVRSPVGQSYSFLNSSRRNV